MTDKLTPNIIIQKPLNLDSTIINNAIHSLNLAKIEMKNQSGITQNVTTNNKVNTTNITETEDNIQKRKHEQDMIDNYSVLFTPKTIKELKSENYNITETIVQYQKYSKLMRIKNLGTNDQRNFIEQNIKSLQEIYKEKFTAELKTLTSYQLIERIGRLDEYSGDFENLIIDKLKKESNETIKPDEAKKYEILLRKLGYNIERYRKDSKADNHQFKLVTKLDLINTYLGSNVHLNLKSKNGITVMTALDSTKISSDQLMSIKKITNLIYEIIPLAESLAITNFSSINDQNKMSIISLYKEMDDKLYIITSMNLQTNTSLIKLDKEFDKLYNIIKEGLNRYTPKSNNLSGGSIVKHKIQQLYYL